MLSLKPFLFLTPRFNPNPNNEPVVSLVTPGISSVDQPAFEMGKTAAKLFIERMHNEQMDDVEIVLKPRMVVRETSLRRPGKNAAKKLNS